MVPSQRTPETTDANPQNSYAYVLVHGSLHTPSIWSPLSTELRSMGHITIAPDLPADKPEATLEDDTNIVLRAVEGNENVVLVAHSRGVETVPGVLAKVALERMNCVVILNSGGPQSFKLKGSEASSTLDPERYTPEFLAGIQGKDEQLYTFDPEQAPSVFYGDVDQSELVKQAVSSLRPQRQVDLDSDPSLTIPDVIPIHVILSAGDRVLNLERARAVYKQWLGERLGERPIIIPGGHTPQLSQPYMLANLLVRLAQTSDIKNSSI